MHFKIYIYYFHHQIPHQWLKSISDIGHFLLFREANKKGHSIARIETEKFLNTTGRCLFLFVSQTSKIHKIRGQLRILSKAENQLTTKKETLDPGDPAPEGYGKNWMPLFHALPEGIHKIIIEAEQFSNGGNNFMLDNIEITTCDNMRKYCFKTDGIALNDA